MEGCPPMSCWLYLHTVWRPIWLAISLQHGPASL